MKTKLLVLIAIGSICALSQACGGDDDDGRNDEDAATADDAAAAHDAETTADAGSDIRTLTIETMCQEMGVQICKSATKCYSGYSSSDCLEASVDGCCSEQEDCDEEVVVEKSDFEQCKSDLAEMSCDDVEAAVVPDSCAEQ